MSVMGRKALWFSPLYWTFMEVALKLYRSWRVHFGRCWTQNVLHSCPSDKNNSNTEKHTQEWWMWWNQCENVRDCVCFLCPLSLSGRPLSNSSQLPADPQKTNTCPAASIRSRSTWNWYLPVHRKLDRATVQYLRTLCFWTVLSF